MADASELRSALRRGFAANLRRLGLALELLAEDVVGDEDASIDWIAASPEGRAWLVVIEPDVAGAALLETALVQRAWVEARIPDWRQLAPNLALREGLAPRLLLDRLALWLRRRLRRALVRCLLLRLRSIGERSQRKRGG